MLYIVELGEREKDFEPTQCLLGERGATYVHTEVANILEKGVLQNQRQSEFEYGGTSLIRTPMGQKKVSLLVRCPHFRVARVVYIHLGWEKCPV